jgi:hypothetical protein
MTEATLRTASHDGIRSEYGDGSVLNTGLRTYPRPIAALEQIEIGPLLPERFREVLGARYDEFAASIPRARKMFAGRVVWHVNSTARGGGVAELLQSLLAYARGTGVDARWCVIGGGEGVLCGDEAHPQSPPRISRRRRRPGQGRA